MFTDMSKLPSKHDKVLDVMKGGELFTVDQLVDATGFLPTSVATMVRNLRKPQYGGHTVERVHLGNRLYAWRLVA